VLSQVFSARWWEERSLNVVALKRGKRKLKDAEVKGKRFIGVFWWGSARSKSSFLGTNVREDPSR
jgi:hypothetical protein